MSVLHVDRPNASTRRSALIGSFLIAPPALFVTAAILKYSFGIGFLFDPLERLTADPARLRVFNFVSPVVILGALLSAFAINAVVVLRLEIRKDREGVVGTVRIRNLRANLDVVVASLLLLSIITAYVIGENWQCWVGIRASC